MPEKAAQRSQAPKPQSDTAAKPVKLLSGGNPQIAKRYGDASAQAYIASMPSWKQDVGRRGEWATYVPLDGHARLRTVQIGMRNDLEAEVLSGLDAGDTVIVSPSDQIRDGVRVKENG